MCSASNTHSSVLFASPNLGSIARWNVAFQVYHALRRDYSDEIVVAVANGMFYHLQTRAIELPCHFAEKNFLRYLPAH